MRRYTRTTYVTYHLFDARTPRSCTRHRRTRVLPRVRVAATAVAMLKADLYIIDRARPRLDGFRHAIRTARTHVTYAVRLWARAASRDLRRRIKPDDLRTANLVGGTAAAHTYVPTAVLENVWLLISEGVHRRKMGASKTHFTHLPSPNN